MTETCELVEFYLKKTLNEGLNADKRPAAAMFVFHSDSFCLSRF